MAEFPAAIELRLVTSTEMAERYRKALESCEAALAAEHQQHAAARQHTRLLLDQLAEKAAAAPQPSGVRVFRVDSDGLTRSRDYATATDWRTSPSPNERLFVLAGDEMLAEFAPGRWANVERLVRPGG